MYHVINVNHFYFVVTDVKHSSYVHSQSKLWCKSPTQGPI